MARVIPLRVNEHFGSQYIRPQEVRFFSRIKKTMSAEVRRKLIEKGAKTYG